MNTPTSPDTNPRKPWVTLGTFTSGQFRLRVRKLDGVRRTEYRCELKRLAADGHEFDYPRFRVGVKVVDGVVQVEALSSEIADLFRQAEMLIAKDAQTAQDAYVLARAEKRKREAK